MTTTTTTRFTAHTPETATGAAAERLGELWHRHNGDLSDMVRTMAGSPALLIGFLDLSRAMKRSRLPRPLAEQISIAVQARLGCARCLGAHIGAGVAAGLEEADIALALRGTAHDPAAAALISYALDVHASPASVGAATITALRAHGHRDRDLLDVIGLVALNHLTGSFNLAAGIEPEEPMNTTTRLAAYAGVLVTAFAGAAGIGLAAGPIDTGGDAQHEALTHDDEAQMPSTGDAADGRAGTSLDADGYRLAPDAIAIPAGRTSEYSFRIVDDSGVAVTEFTMRHERDLHLIVASRDLRSFHHLHPEHDGHGTWAIELPALEPGAYRVFADTQPAAGVPITLGVDLHVTDGAIAQTAAEVSTTDHVDGFDVILDGSPVVGSAALSFTVGRDGEPVATEPYLGAAGHLVVLRSGDLAYVHAHADEAAGDQTIGFDVAFPSAGTYRLFLDFAVAGGVHTADFTVQVPDRTSTAPMNTTASTTAPTHGGH
jgi:AhpD family alkylhydroperoxidase